jgi:hypothetical protein
VPHALRYLIGSHSSAIRTDYRIMLRPSSLWEPKHSPQRLHKVLIKHIQQFGGSSVNDPSAGSPTETLLRLLLPLSDKVHKTSLMSYEASFATPQVRVIHRITQSVGATGGVYKGQGHIQHKLMTCAYEEFLVQDQ